MRVLNGKKKKKLLKSFLHTCLHPAPVRLSRTADTFCSSPHHMLALLSEHLLTVDWSHLFFFVWEVQGRSPSHFLDVSSCTALSNPVSFFSQKRAVVNYTVGFYEVSQPIFSPIVTLRDCPRWASFLLCKNLISRSPKQQKLKEPFQFENWQKTVCTLYRKSVFCFLFFSSFGVGGSPFCLTLLFVQLVQPSPVQSRKMAEISQNSVPVRLLNTFLHQCASPLLLPGWWDISHYIVFY